MPNTNFEMFLFRFYSGRSDGFEFDATVQEEVRDHVALQADGNQEVRGVLSPNEDQQKDRIKIYDFNSSYVNVNLNSCSN
jgi:hypothetical protein